MRPAGYRRKKYEKKVDGTIVGQRFATQKKSMANQKVETDAQIVRIIDDVKQMMEAEGVSVIMLPYYLHYARELYKASRNFTGETLFMEAETMKDKWRARGLDLNLLSMVRNYFGIPERMNVCVMDVDHFGECLLG